MDILRLQNGRIVEGKLLRNVGVYLSNKDMMRELINLRNNAVDSFDFVTKFIQALLA